MCVQWRRLKTSKREEHVKGIFLLDGVVGEGLGGKQQEPSRREGRLRKGRFVAVRRPSRDLTKALPPYTASSKDPAEGTLHCSVLLGQVEGCFPSAGHASSVPDDR